MKQLTWLHISDIHSCPKGTDWDADDIYRKLMTDIEKLKKEHDLSPHLIFVTGDIMFGKNDNCGTFTKQYEKAEEFLKKLMYTCNVKLKKLFLVPGNHDVNKNNIKQPETLYLKALDERAMVSMLESKNTEWTRIIKRLDKYKSFLKNTLSANHLLTDQSHLIYAETRKIHGIKIGIAGFNTAWSCLGEGAGDRGKMWLGGKWQIKTLDKALQDCDIKIGLSHHPFTWHTGEEDSDIVLSLQKHFDFHLHGHEHSTWVEPLNDSHHCRVAAGAIYAQKEMLKESGYNIVRLDFEKNIGEIWLRRYDNKRGGDWASHIIEDQTDNNGMKEVKLNKLFPHFVGTLLVTPSAKLESPPSEPPPELATHTSKLGGICEYYPLRINITPNYWNTLYKSAEKRINLLGHSMAPPFSDNVLPRWEDFDAPRKKELKIKVIVLNPDNEQLHTFIKAQTNESANKQLKIDINATIDKIQQIKKEIALKERKAGSESIIQIRITDRIIYNSITIFDNKGMITLYSSKENIGDRSPTFRIESIPINADDKTDSIKNTPSSSLEFYEEEFDTYWATGTHPEEQRRRNEFDANSRISNHKTQINKIHDWLDAKDGKSQTLPPPLMLVVHPTNVCSEVDGARLCENCTFATAPAANTEIDYDILKRIIEESIAMEIKNFEFSGGGEPLEYSKINDVISLLGELKEKHSEKHGEKHGINCGLLTNGLSLTEKLRNSIFKSNLFSYVRFHYSEGIQKHETKASLFHANLNEFLVKNRNLTVPRIGIKLLLKKGCKNELLKNILNLKKNLGTNFGRINHFQIKPMWGGDKVRPGEQECLDFRNEFFDYLFAAYPEKWPDDVQVDLGTYKVHNNFKCQLNPLRGVIDPTGNLLICSNYLSAYNKLIIGDLKKKHIEDVWGKEKHHGQATSIPYSKVCNDSDGCPCRFIRYHEILSRNDNKGTYVPDGLGDFI